MRVDTEYRVVIPKELRKISSVGGHHVVALMSKDENLFYLLPKEEYDTGKFISLFCIGQDSRICLRKIIEGREEKNILVYLEDKTIYIQLID